MRRTKCGASVATDGLRFRSALLNGSRWLFIQKTGGIFYGVNEIYDDLIKLDHSLRAEKFEYLEEVIRKNGKLSRLDFAEVFRDD